MRNWICCSNRIKQHLHQHNRCTCCLAMTLQPCSQASWPSWPSGRRVVMAVLAVGPPGRHGHWRPLDWSWPSWPSGCRVVMAVCRLASRAAVRKTKIACHVRVGQRFRGGPSGNLLRISPPFHAWHISMRRLSGWVGLLNPNLPDGLQNIEKWRKLFGLKIS